MNRFGEICQADIEWRTGQIAMIKKSTVLSSTTDDMREILRKYSVPALYAIWEGFVTFIFSEYVKVINDENIPVADIDQRIMTYHSFSVLNLSSPPTHTQQKEGFVLKMLKHFSDKVNLSTDISTDANVNYKSLSSIMHRYGLDPLPSEKYQDAMNKFLMFRNKIAHGDRAIAVDNDIISEFSELINDLMSDLFLTLENAIIERKYVNER